MKELADNPDIQAIGTKIVEDHAKSVREKNKVRSITLSQKNFDPDDGDDEEIPDLEEIHQDENIIKISKIVNYFSFF